MEGYLRIGYANSEAILREGLKRLSQFLKEQQQAVACA
jgi:aspartate/methionine/tyrosine aminotransferase